MSTASATRHLRRDAEANRQRILEAAGRLMADRGLATPLEDIAAAAGVGIATLYRRFPTRRALVEALFEDRLADYVEDLESAAAMPDGWEALVWFMRRSLGRRIANRALSELIEHDPGPGAIRVLRERVVPLAAGLVERARATGRLRPDFTVGDLAVIQHMVVSVGALTGGTETWQRYLTFLLDGVVTDRPGPTPPPTPALELTELRDLAAPPRRC